MCLRHIIRHPLSMQVFTVGFQHLFVYFLSFRSKDIEALSGNGDMAFQEVRIQQSVVEFILNHADQIFSSEQIKVKEGMTLLLLRRNVELKHFLSYQHKKQHFIFLQGQY